MVFKVGILFFGKWGYVDWKWGIFVFGDGINVVIYCIFFFRGFFVLFFNF